MSTLSAMETVTVWSEEPLQEPEGTGVTTGSEGTGEIVGARGAEGAEETVIPVWQLKEFAKICMWLAWHQQLFMPLFPSLGNNKPIVIVMLKDLNVSTVIDMQISDINVAAGTLIINQMVLSAEFTFIYNNNNNNKAF
ncbi:hypothetical protein ACJX0J_030400 [Zea mays]